MKLMKVITTYVVLKQSLGIKFESTGRVLRQFGRSMGDIAIDEVGPREVAAFLRGKGRLSATWTVKYRALFGLYRFAISRGHVDNSPLPVSRPKLPPPLSPYVYSTDELRRLIEATATLYSVRSPLQVPTYRMLLLVLYGTGMRISEALGLTLRDVDLVHRIITVRDTKFYKTRLVPIGPEACPGAWRAYRAKASVADARWRRLGDLCDAQGKAVGLSACHLAVPASAPRSRHRLSSR